MARKRSRPPKKTTASESSTATVSHDDQVERNLAQRHFSIGWAGLAIFAILGLFLESMHGLKLDYYLDVRNETRRLMWTLAHTHGTLFSLANIALAATIHSLNLDENRLSIASSCVLGALLIMPAGFFFGGVWLYGGDPGWGIILAPIGGILFVIGTALVAIATRNQNR